MPNQQMYTTADDLFEVNMSPGYVNGLGMMGAMGELEAGVDYYHPLPLRLRYAFTKAADKAPIPTEKAATGMWWVLTRLPTGVYFYNLEDKPADVLAKEAVQATQSVQSALTYKTEISQAKSRTTTYIIVGGSVVLASVLGYMLLRKR